MAIETMVCCGALTATYRDAGDRRHAPGCPTVIAAADLSVLIDVGTRWPSVSREAEHRALDAASRVATAVGEHPAQIWEIFVAPPL